MTTRFSEIFLVRATLTPEEFVWKGTATENEEWENALREFEESGEDAEIPLSSRDISFGIRLADDPSPEIWLNVDLPETYPRTGGQETQNGPESGEPSLTLSGASCPREQLAELKEVMETRLLESQREGLDNKIFDVLSSLQSYLSDNPLPDLQPKREDEIGEKKDTSQTEPDRIIMARVIFWTHHLKAPSKRKDFAAWCPELDIWGITKLGYPGFLCWEGAAPDVDEMVKRVKGLQWAALSLRSDVRWVYSKDKQEVVNNLEAGSPRYKHLNKGLVDPALFRDAILSCPLSINHSGSLPYSKGESQPKDVKTSLDEVETVKELVERFRGMGVPEQEFVDALSLRTSG